MFVRLFAILTLFTGLGACTIEPPLDQAVAQTLRVKNVSVTVSGG